MVLALAAMLFAASPSDQDQARAWVRSAKDAFDAGDFARAAELLDRATALAPTPATVYNLGRARERAGDLSLAIDAYRRYLELATDPSDRKAVEATIADLQHRLDDRRRLDELQHAKPVVVQVPVLVQERSPVFRVLPWVVTVLGLGGIGAGLGLGLEADRIHARAVLQTDAELSAATQASSIRAAQGANLAYSSGGVVLAAGLLWLVLEYALASATPEPPHAP